MDQAHEMQIGELGQALGLSPKTIRYYEDIGLLPSPQRRTNGYRLYTARDAEQLHFILKAKSIGLSHREIREIVMLKRAGAQPCGRVETLIEEKLAAVEEQLLALVQARDELVALHTEAERTKTAAACICGIIEQHAVAN